MDDFKVRLINERKELKERIGKLSAFMLTTVFAKLPEIDRKLLLEQAVYMSGYADILDQRVDRLV